VFLGGALQLAFQIPSLRRIGMLPRFSINLQDEGVRRIFRLMAPAVLGVSVAQVSLLLNTVFASFLNTGSVSWLYYADRLMEFPAGMLGAALGTILLPSLAKCHAAEQHEEYSRLLDWGLRLTFLLAAPAALALAILAVPLITTLFHHGAFTATDVFRTRDALVAYSIGLLGLILVKVLAPGFYARQNIRTPVRIALLTLFRHAGAEPAPDRLAATCRPGPVHRPGRQPQRHAALPRSAPASASIPRSPAGCCSTADWLAPC
jgi:putative peptidoglycan lipid II flippase